MAEDTVGNGNGNGFLSRYNAIISTVTVVALIVGALWAGVISPLAARVDKLEDRSLPRSEHFESVRRFDESKALLLSRIERLEAGLVSRSEHETRWRQYDDRISDLSARIQEINTSIRSTYTVGDELKALRRQVEQLTNTNTKPAPQ